MDTLSVFLGNPGKKYVMSRHNLAWLFLDYLPFSHGLDWKRKFKADYAQTPLHNGKKLIILKPLTFMNRSGESVAAAAAFFKLTVKEIIVVHDDVELPFASYGFKAGGGLAGHNGLRSVSQSLGSNDFVRFRLGIGRPPRGDVSSYVLSQFSTAEQEQLPRFLADAAAEFMGVLEGR